MSVLPDNEEVYFKNPMRCTRCGVNLEGKRFVSGFAINKDVEGLDENGCFIWCKGGCERLIKEAQHDWLQRWVGERV